MLLGMDEYPDDQITESFSGVASSDPQWNDGRYICLSNGAGRVSLTSSLRLDANNDMMDRVVCLRRNGRQHNIRVPCRLRPDTAELRVGPLRIKVVRLTQEMRLVLEDNDFGITLNLICHSTTVPYQDPVEITRVDGRLLGERSTYVTMHSSGWDRHRRAALRTQRRHRRLLP